jgi:hypothetical protein
LTCKYAAGTQSKSIIAAAGRKNARKRTPNMMQEMADMWWTGEDVNWDTNKNIWIEGAYLL